MTIPRHIALIPDGNRRWAKKQGLNPWDGHKAGIDRFKEFLDWCYDAGVEEVTAYSLSKENLAKRNRAEMDALFKLYEGGFRELLSSPAVKKRQLRVSFVGDLSHFPPGLKNLIREVESNTKEYTKCKLTLCINYSGREEILEAAEKLAKSGKAFTEANFERFLQIRSQPDLLIRTAEKRISNFMLWQSAYSEVFFSAKMFPDFSKKDFDDAIEQYQNTKRKYGK